MTETGSVDEIAVLLDQCSPEELADILQAIEGGEDFTTLTAEAALMPTQAPQQAVASSPGKPSPQGVVPSPPSGPPSNNQGPRRPAPTGYKKVSPGEEAVVTVGEMKKLLDEHSEGVLNEVRSILSPRSENAAKQALPEGSLNLEVLSTVLGERDQEVISLEARLAELQDQLSAKDQCVMDLNSELDSLNREVRHRQLDLEFQQLKLEERVRSNKELEQAQRNLTTMLDETSRDVRHAALDADMSRSGNMPPRSPRVQGSIPWMLRNSRQQGTSAWTAPAALNP